MGVWVTEALGGISHSNGTAQEGAADGVSSKNRPADDRRPLWESTHHLQISVRSVSLTHVKVEPTLWGFSELREKKKKESIHWAQRRNPAAYFQTIAEKRKMYAVENVSTWVGIYTELGWVSGGCVPLWWRER